MTRCPCEVRYECRAVAFAPVFSVPRRDLRLSQVSRGRRCCWCGFRFKTRGCQCVVVRSSSRRLRPGCVRPCFCSRFSAVFRRRSCAVAVAARLHTLRHADPQAVLSWPRVYVRGFVVAVCSGRLLWRLSSCELCRLFRLLGTGFAVVVAASLESTHLSRAKETFRRSPKFLSAGGSPGRDRNPIIRTRRII